MSDTIRFPFTERIPGIGDAELDQVILLDVAVGTIPVGGTIGNTIAPWKIDEIANNGSGTAAPYGCVVIELVSFGGGTGIIGDGLTNMVGLYGTINDSGYIGAPPERYLLGVLGLNLGNKLPQIPFVLAGDGMTAMYAQAVNLVACYDSLSIGGVLADMDIGELTLQAYGRPVRRRVYGG